MERTRSDGIVDARMDLAEWLRAGRDRRKLTIEDVAKVTKIQPRILEKLESGQLEGLPAEVFVRGFVRSFAKCVGLDESEALEKYGAAQAQPASQGVVVAKALVETMARSVDIETKRVAQGTPSEAIPVVADPVTVTAPLIGTDPVVEAAPVVEVAPVVAHVDAAPIDAAPVVEAAPVVDAAPVVEIAPAEIAVAVEAPKKKRSKKNSKQRARKKKQVEQELAAVAASVAVVDNEVATNVFEKQTIETSPVAKIDAESVDSASIEAKTNEPLTSDGTVEHALAEGSHRMKSAQIAAVEAAVVESTTTTAEPCATEIVADAAPVTDEVQETSGSWQPTMPPISTSPSMPWRRPSLPVSTASAYVVPSLVIDDADPDSADRERDDRAIAAAGKEPHRLSFLPPILLDREDRSSRQGGLTLAVIILLIAATLTLSYLRRRPSPSGDGVTMLDGSSMLVS